MLRLSVMGKWTELRDCKITHVINMGYHWKDDQLIKGLPKSASD